MLLLQPSVPLRHSLAGTGRELKDGDGRIDTAGHLQAACDVEIQVGEEVDLVEEHDRGIVKHLRILERLVLSLGDGEHDDLVVFSQVEGRGADQVPHVLDEDDPRAVEVEGLQRLPHRIAWQRIPLPISRYGKCPTRVEGESSNGRGWIPPRRP